MTRSYLMGLIGEGITRSLTPPMHEREGAEQGLAYVYRPVDLLELGLPPESVGELLRQGARLGFDAFNVTHPCKQIVLGMLDEVEPAAARIGAVNTVLIRDGRLIGTNTDRSGFASGFRHALPGADLTHVVQIGAGGAGSAVADALVGLGARRLTIVDVDGEKARALADLVGRHAPSEPVPGSDHAPTSAAPESAVLDSAPQPRAAVVDVADSAQLPELLATAAGVVNTSPVGMHTHPGLPLPVEDLRPQTWVADVVYRPTRTALIEAAEALGCRVMEGGHMAVGQAVDTFELVTGRGADRERMRRHFAELVAAEAQVPAHSGAQEVAPR